MRTLSPVCIMQSFKSLQAQILLSCSDLLCRVRINFKTQLQGEGRLGNAFLDQDLLHN